MPRIELLTDFVDLSIPPVEDIANSLIIYTDGSWAEDEPYAGKIFFTLKHTSTFFF